MKTKHYTKSHLVLAGWALLFMVGGCTKSNNNPGPNPSQSILKIVESGSNFTLLKEAILRTSLDATLDARGTFTVFAPTDDAFRAAGFANVAAIDAAPVPTLAAILEHHIIQTVNKVADIPVANNTRIATVLNATTVPDSIFVTKISAGAVSVDGIPVTQADLLATNGVVHVIGSVLPKFSLRSILEIVASNPNFTFLKVAAIKANLTAALSGAGTLTLFAPTDSAFKAAGLGLTDTNAVKALPVSALTAILTHHVLGAVFHVADLPTAHNTPVPTLANGVSTPDSLYVTKTAAGVVYVDGTQVKVADILANNGVVHIIGSLLIPPAGNIIDYVAFRAAGSPAEFTLLQAAIVHAGLIDSLKKGPLTVFAPTNAAFAATPYSTIAKINKAPRDTIAKILKQHVIAGRVFASDLVVGKLICLNPKADTIGLLPSPTVKGPSNASPSNIIVTNIITTNGVIHAIDQVLLP